MKRNEPSQWTWDPEEEGGSRVNWLSVKLKVSVEGESSATVKST